VSNAPTAPTDSRRAWTIAAGAFAANVAMFGSLNSFGTFFDAMAREFNAGSGAIALMFALTMFVYFSLGLVTGPLTDRIGPRPLLIAGGVLAASGLLLTSVANSIWMGYACYGIGVGAGAACVYVPLLATLGGWFERHRTTALGIAASGIAGGTMIANPLFARLIDAIGYRATYVINGAAVFVTLVLVALIVERPPVRAVRTQTDARAAARELAADPAFARYYISGALMSMVIFLPLVFLTKYASDNGAGHMEAAMLLAALGGASIIGRLGIGVAATRFGLLPLYRASFAAVAAAMLLWFAAGDHTPVLWTFAVVFGAVSGAWVAMLPAAASELFGSQRLGVTLGIVFTGGAIGALAGPPLAGAIIDASGDYEAAIALSGGLAFLAWTIIRPIGEPIMIEQVAQPAA
jgi:MFS family permease